MLCLNQKLKTNMEVMEDMLFKVRIVLFCYAAFSLYKLVKRPRRYQVRRKWIRDILSKRQEEGAFSLLIPRLMSDKPHYRNYFRMSYETFSLLLSLVEPDLNRTDTQMRQCVSATERLAITLRYLATGTCK